MALSKVSINDVLVYDPLALLEWCKRQDPPINPSSFWGTVNTFYLPRGLEPARGWFLLTYKSMKSAGLNNGAATPVELRISLEGSGYPDFVYQHLYFVRATAIAAGYFNDQIQDGIDANTMYLCEFTDIRGLAANFSRIDSAFNMRAPEGGFLPGTAPQLGYQHRDDNPRGDQAPPEDKAKPYSWEQLLRFLWERLPDAFRPQNFPLMTAVNLPKVPQNFPPRDNDPTEPQIPGEESTFGFPENYAFQGVPVLSALARVLHDLNLTLVPPRLTTDPWRLRTLAIEEQRLIQIENRIKPSLRFVIENNLPLFSTATYLPETVAVVFPRRQYLRVNDAICSADDWRNRPTETILITTLDVVPNIIAQNFSTLPGTVHHIYLSQCADVGYNTDGGGFGLLNRNFLTAQAKKAATDYVLSTIYAEAPERKTFTGIPPFLQAQDFTLPHERWSAVMIYDHGQGLKTDLLRYPRFPAEHQLAPFSSSGTGASMYLTTRPGAAIGGQLSHFPVPEIGAPPSLSRPGSSLTVTPHERRAIVKLSESVNPKTFGLGIVMQGYVDPTPEEDPEEESDLPYLPEESETQSPTQQPKRKLVLQPGAQSIDVFNQNAKTVAAGIILAEYDWALGVWLISETHESGILIEEATLDRDLNSKANASLSESTSQTEIATATMIGTFNPAFRGKKVRIIDDYNWPLSEGTRILILHIKKASWMVLKAARTELEVFGYKRSKGNTDGSTECFDMFVNRLHIDYKPQDTGEDGIFALLPQIDGSTEEQWEIVLDKKCVKKVPHGPCS